MGACTWFGPGSDGPTPTSTTTATTSAASPATTSAPPMDLAVAGDGTVSWVPESGDGDYRIVVDEQPIAVTSPGRTCRDDRCRLGVEPADRPRLVEVVATTSGRRGAATVPPGDPPQARAPRPEVEVVRLVDGVPTVQVVEVASAAEAQALVAELDDDPDVLAVVPDIPGVAFAQDAPSPDSPGQVTGDDVGDLDVGATYASDLRLAEVHEISRGAGQRVAVVDLGVAPLDVFGDRLLDGANVAAPELPGTVPYLDHGTAVAGLAASNDARLPGTAPAATVLPLALVDPDDDRGVTAANTIAALLHPAMDDVDVVVMSFGLTDDTGLFDFFDDPLGDLEQVLADLAEAGVVLVAATGNHATEECPGTQDFPVGVAPPPAASTNVLAVSGDNACSVALPPEGAGLHAPDGPLPVLTADGTVAIASGTSFAAPLVAGLVADLRACGHQPRADAVELLARHDDEALDPVAALRDPDARCVFHLADSTVETAAGAQVALVGDLVHRGNGRLTGTGGLRLPAGLDCGPAFPDGIAAVAMEAEIDATRTTLAIDPRGVDLSAVPTDGPCADVAALVSDYPVQYLLVGNQPDGGPFDSELPPVGAVRLELRSGACPTSDGWCSPAPPSPSTEPTETTEPTRAAGDPALRHEGLGGLDFSTSSDDALPRLREWFGEPAEVEPSPDPDTCQYTGRWVRWDGGLQVTLAVLGYDPTSGEEIDPPRETFTGWAVSEGSTLTTADGIGVGSTVADIRAAEPTAEVLAARSEDIFDNGFPIDFPPEFTLPGDLDDTFSMGGRLSSAQPDGRVESMAAGQPGFCFE